MLLFCIRKKMIMTAKYHYTQWDTENFSAYFLCVFSNTFFQPGSNPYDF